MNEKESEPGGAASPLLSSRTPWPPPPTTQPSPALTRKGVESQPRKEVYCTTAMRSIWLAGVATAASSTAAAGMSPPVTAAAAAAAATATFVPRGLGGVLSRARLAGSRRSRSSPAAAAATPAGFVIRGCRAWRTTSTWAAGATRQHVSPFATARRPRPAAQSSFSRSWASTLGRKSGAGAFGVGGGRSSRLMFSAEADVGSAATTQEQAVEGTHGATLSGEAGRGEREGGEEEAGPEPLKVSVERHRQNGAWI